MLQTVVRGAARIVGLHRGGGGGGGRLVYPQPITVGNLLNRYCFPTK